MPTTQFIESATESVQYAAEGMFGVTECVQASMQGAWMHECALILRLCMAKEEGRTMDHVIGEYEDWCAPLDMLQKGTQVTCSMPHSHGINAIYAACLSAGCIHNGTVL